MSGVQRQTFRPRSKRFSSRPSGLTKHRTNLKSFIDAVWVRDFLRPLVRTYCYVRADDLRLLEWTELLVFRAFLGITGMYISSEKFIYEPLLLTYRESVLLREVRRRTFNHLYFRYLNGLNIDEDHLAMMVKLLNTPEWVFPFWDSSAREENLAVENCVITYLMGEIYAPIDFYSAHFKMARRSLLEDGKVWYNSKELENILLGGRLDEKQLSEFKKIVGPDELLLSIPKNRVHRAYCNLMPIFQPNPDIARKFNEALENQFADEYRSDLTVMDAVELGFFRLRLTSGLFVSPEEEMKVRQFNKNVFFHASSLSDKLWQERINGSITKTQHQFSWMHLLRSIS